MTKKEDQQKDVEQKKVQSKKIKPKKVQLNKDSKIRIKIKSYDHKVLDNSCKQIIDAASRFVSLIVGPLPLPTTIRRYTVNRATFIDKNAREQFEIRTHKRLIDIFDPNPKVVDALMNLNLPAGVDIEIKM